MYVESLQWAGFSVKLKQTHKHLNFQMPEMRLYYITYDGCCHLYKRQPTTAYTFVKTIECVYHYFNVIDLACGLTLLSINITKGNL